MDKSRKLALGVLLLGYLFAAPAVVQADDKWGRQGGHADGWRDAPANVGQNLKYGKQGPGKHHKGQERGREKAKAPHHKAPPAVHWHGKPSKAEPHKHHPASKVREVHHHHHHYHAPKYVYVQHVHKPRHWGRHLYRGLYWPFLNVTIVLPLSARQIEYHHQAVYVALDGAIGQVVRWQDGGISGSVVVLREGISSHGGLCREYRQTVTERGRTISHVETSCIDPYGYWIPI